MMAEIAYDTYDGERIEIGLYDFCSCARFTLPRLVLKSLRRWLTTRMYIFMLPFHYIAQPTLSSLKKKKCVHHSRSSSTSSDARKDLARPRREGEPPQRLP